MPTILIIGKLKFLIYFQDHGMPHVHVMGPDAEAKIILSNQNVVKSKGFSAKEIKLIQKVVKEHKAKLMEAWEDAKS